MVTDRVRRELQQYRDSIINVERGKQIDRLKKRLKSLIDKLEKLYLPTRETPAANREQTAALSEQLSDIIEKLRALKGDPITVGQELEQEREDGSGKSNTDTFPETSDRMEFSSGEIAFPWPADSFIDDRLGTWAQGVGRILQDDARRRPQSTNVAGYLGRFHMSGAVLAP